ncbi:MAG: glycine betaine ABC transporter substrate-binding protein [Halieaceae bacterium]|jgi:osmoprotectant transport system permease protein|nr:glycine betaine ABC transporter substrate-binding protein [Halieaceae bacterium]
MRRQLAHLLFALLLTVASLHALAEGTVTVGSKPFGENYLLAEMIALLLEDRGYRVERRHGLGGSAVTFAALKAGEIDVYPEYSGTLKRGIFALDSMEDAALDAALEREGLRFSHRFGFENGYALVVPRRLAEELGLSRISDLREYAQLRLGFSHEFVNREDGWPALREAYGLPQRPAALEHALAYRALESGSLDVTDAYTTDGDLAIYDLRLLEDDLGVFPAYDAGILARPDLPEAVDELLEAFDQRFDESTMQRLNRRVSSDGEAAIAVAAEQLAEIGLIAPREVDDSRSRRIANNTLIHLKLTLIALVLACLLAIPLSLSVARSPRIARSLQYGAGLVQTIPALALLALLIPFLGLGEGTAIVALFLYSLLPIVRNTLAGLFSVDPLLREVAMGMGLTPVQQTLRIELPLAMPMILAGIRTAAVISIGTATLAAFVGAGGLGQPIITGLSLNDNALILEGAIPAAVLAVAVEVLFEAIERSFVPAHLRVR